jgi:hypothetical protein
MEGRFRLVLKHWLIGLLVSFAAATAAGFLRAYILGRCNLLLDGLAGNAYLIPAIAGVVPLCVAVVWPRRTAASLRSICQFPRHLGLLIKTIVGTAALVVADLAIFGEDSYYNVEGVLTAWTMGTLIGATFLAYPIATWLASSGGPKPRQRQMTRQETPLSDRWLTGDKPVETVADGPFPEHIDVAERILAKLLPDHNTASGLTPNLALIGPYGSGKTSICNLVEDLYLTGGKKRNAPRMLFCRFEAWQSLSPEAATTGLVRTVTMRILEATDELSLWRVPDSYLNAIMECGGQWSKLAGPLLRASNDPGHILSQIGDTLVRLNLRLVVFVDDFDRIEGDSGASQEAVAKAINQFQLIPNLQYVIAIGPVSGHGPRPTDRRVSWDLLKLTRYQERVPTFQTSHLAEQVRRYRDSAQQDHDAFLPWAYVPESDTDPLKFNSELAHLHSQLGLFGKIVGLIDTPRACKGMIRETVAAWESGLKGEIDWYDLLLLNAMKAAEPGVFEWIARDPDVFVGELPRATTPHDKDREEKYAHDMRSRLESAMSTSDPKRVEAVKGAIAYLFPHFNAKLESGTVGHPVGIPAEPWSQRVSVRAGRSDYLLRFLAGRVVPTDVPDRPTLRYFKMLAEKNFDPTEFVRLYLDTPDKMTGPLNKAVQFAGLIQPTLACQICDTILDWIADPAHATMWPEPERFMADTLPDVLAIVDRAGSGLRSHSPGLADEDDEAAEDDTDRWTEATVKRYMPTAPALSLAMAERSAKRGNAQMAEQLRALVLQDFKHHFIQQRRPLLPGLAHSRFSLASLLGDLSRIVGREQYSAIKLDLTNALVSQTQGPEGRQMAEQIVFSLLQTLRPARRGEIAPEEYQFNLDHAANEANYDMSLILPILRDWPVGQGDPLTERAATYLRHAYGLG